MLEMRRLRLLHAVARHGTVSAAAEALRVSGPAISQQLATLEREAGLPLVQRHGRRLELTDAGRTLVAHTDVLLDQLAAAEADLLAMRTEVSGTVRIAAFPSATQAIVADAWRAIAAQHSERLRLRLITMDPADAMAAMGRGDIELAVAYSYDLLPFAEPAGFERYELLVDPVVAAVPEAELHDASPVELADLTDMPWLTVPGDTTCHEMLQRACGLAGFVPGVVAQCDSYPPLLALVAAGAGVTLLPSLGAQPLPPGVALRPLKRPINRAVFAVTRHAGDRNPAVSVVLDQLRASASKIEPW